MHEIRLLPKSLPFGTSACRSRLPRRLSIRRFHGFILPTFVAQSVEKLKQSSQRSASRETCRVKGAPSPISWTPAIARNTAVMDAFPPGTQRIKDDQGENLVLSPHPTDDPNQPLV